MRVHAALQYLRRHAGRPCSAIELAQALGVAGNRERRRRTVRLVIEAMHEDGHKVCADCHPQGGYWIARTQQEWEEYKAARARQLRFGFARLSQATRMVTERISGQGKLWDEATVGIRG